MTIKRWLVLIPLCLLIAGCEYHESPQPPREYSDEITHEQAWQREDAVAKRQRAEHETDSGFSGAFACHTADGGCLHMTCSTKTSCDYMAEMQKRCAVPTVKDDLKILDKLIVKDDACPSVEQPPQQSMAVVPNGTVTYWNGIATPTGSGGGG
jgi:hypothetical protein